MDFEDLLGYYEVQLEYIKRSMIYMNIDYVKGYLDGLLRFFREIKREYSFVDELSIRSLTPEEERFRESNLIGYLDYRGSYPVYYDDYGQSYYIIVDDKEYCGGSFNSCPELDFSDFIDECLLRKEFGL